MMQSAIKNVGDLDATARLVIERVFGQTLRETERITLTIEDENSAYDPTIADTLPSDIPEHWKVYDGLTDHEIDEVSRSIVRTEGTRHF